MKKVMGTIAVILSSLSAAFGALHFFRAKSAAGSLLLVPKMLAGAFAPFLAVFGFFGALLGVVVNWPFALFAGMFGAGASARYVWRAARAGGDFDAAFGQGWSEQIPAEQAARMLKGRWTWRPSLNEEMYLIKDIAFYTVPDSERQLMCDLWQPPLGVARSGLAFIYFHGSGWHFLDKDMGTGSLFRHLAAQGHVVMDVAYRLCPETGWQGMLDDVKHAIAWMKRNAAHYGVDPDRIVLGGGSAGAHLALLAAYTAGQRDLTPDDLRGTDLSVCGVVSWYGPTDMILYYHHAGKILSTLVNKETPATAINRWLTKVVSFKMETPAHWQPGTTVQDSMMRALLGGTPDEVPEMYRRASPVVYAGRHCPTTLLLQGEHDSLVSAEGAQALAERLRSAGVQVIYVEYPQTEHAFDLLPPGVSPAAQASWYEAERFLALLASKPKAAPVGPGTNGVGAHRAVVPQEVVPQEGVPQKGESELVPAQTLIR